MTQQTLPNVAPVACQRIIGLNVLVSTLLLYRNITCCCLPALLYRNITTLLLLVSTYWSQRCYYKRIIILLVSTYWSQIVETKAYWSQSSRSVADYPLLVLLCTAAAVSCSDLVDPLDFTGGIARPPPGPVRTRHTVLAGRIAPADFCCCVVQRLHTCARLCLCQIGLGVEVDMDVVKLWSVPPKVLVWFAANEP